MRKKSFFVVKWAYPIIDYLYICWRNKKKRTSLDAESFFTGMLLPIAWMICFSTISKIYNLNKKETNYFLTTLAKKSFFVFGNALHIIWENTREYRLVKSRILAYFMQWQTLPPIKCCHNGMFFKPYPTRCFLLSLWE